MPDEADKPKTTGRPSLHTQEREEAFIKGITEGLAQRKASDLIGVDYSTVKRWLAADEAFRARVKAAAASTEMAMAANLRELAAAGNAAANIFWLKSRGWRDDGSHAGEKAEEAQTRFAITRKEAPAIGTTTDTASEADTPPEGATDG